MSPDTQADGFTNRAVAAQALPDFRDAPLEPVAPAYRPYAVIAAGLGWLAPAGAGLVAWFGAHGGLLPGAVAVVALGALVLMTALGLFAMVLAALDASRRRWALREHDLVYRSGVLWHRSVIVPFARIQHVETVSGPLERRFGLTRLKCYTAGGAGGDLTVAGLHRETARRLRQYLLERIRDGEDDAPQVEGSRLASPGDDG